jgi:uncharacterized protein
MLASTIQIEASADLAARVAAVNWDDARANLLADGVAILRSLLPNDQCRDLAGVYADCARFRSRVVMQRHGFGRGEYQYFTYPLPSPVQTLRECIYPHLAPIANRWSEMLGTSTRFPDSLDEFLDRCHAADQGRPTPLLLRYGAGDFNCLHQDLYGEHVFPLQLVALLSEPGRDFAGGELVLVEQRPRQQSKVRVVSLRQGDAAIFAVNHRPQQGARGWYRVAMKHGVSPLERGERHTLGVIFHDAA